MNNLDHDLERLWEELLSQQPEQVKAGFSRLQAEEQQAVLSHLAEMSTAEGWHPSQRLAAQVALEILQEQD